jgi:hypothetical protein
MPPGNWNSLTMQLVSNPNVGDHAAIITFATSTELIVDRAPRGTLADGLKLMACAAQAFPCSARANQPRKFAARASPSDLCERAASRPRDTSARNFDEAAGIWPNSSRHMC